jgi:hypothetical protein
MGQRKNCFYVVRYNAVPVQYGTAQEYLRNWNLLLCGTGQCRNRSCVVRDSAGIVPARYGTAQELFLRSTGQHRNRSCMVRDRAGSFLRWVLQLNAEGISRIPKCWILNAESWLPNSLMPNAVECQISECGMVLNAEFLNAEWDCAKYLIAKWDSVPPDCQMRLCESVPFESQSWASILWILTS